MERLKEMLEALQEITKGCRSDMHEPDEQGLSAVAVQGYGLDNACCPLIHAEPPIDDNPQHHYDLSIFIERDMGEGKESMRVAITVADLINLARKADLSDANAIPKQDENARLRSALETISRLYPPDDQCAQKADEVYGPNDGKMRGILLKCALDVARKTLETQ